MSGVSKCVGMAGQELEECLRSPLTATPPNIEGLWLCVRDEYVKGGGKEKGLFKKANVGFVAEPMGFKRFMDDPSQLEPQEKLEFAYNDPRFYGCLHSNGYPVPFAMNSFSSDILIDDQKRFEIQGAVDAIKAEVAREGKRFPNGSDAWRREVARRFQGWGERSLEFNGDCRLEMKDYEAVAASCGLCTESSTPMYYGLNYGGLNPKFLHFRNMKPTLDWIDLLPKLGMVQYHVFLGIPMSSGEPVHVDLINRRFDARYAFTTELSARHFVVAWIQNRRKEFDMLGKFSESVEMDKLAMAIAPEDPEPQTSLYATYLQMRRPGDAEALRQAIARRFSDHPLVMFRMAQTDLNRDRLPGQPSPIGQGGAPLPGLDEEIERRYDELEGRDPSSAAQVNYFQAAGELAQLTRLLPQVSSARQRGAEISPQDMASMSGLANSVLMHLGRSMLLDPNFVFAYRDALNLFAAVAEAFGEVGQFFEVAVTFFDTMLAKHPDHAPFIHAAAAARLKLAEKTPKGARIPLLLKAREHVARLKAMEPNHPAGHELESWANFISGDINGAAAAMDRANGLQRARKAPVSKENLGHMLLFTITAVDAEGAQGALNDAFAEYPREAPSFLSEALVERYNWYASIGTTEDGTMSDTVIPVDVEQQDRGRDMVSMTEGILDRLAAHQEAVENVSAVRAYLLPMAALVLDPDDLKVLLGKITAATSGKVQGKLADGLKKAADIYLASNRPIAPLHYERLEGLCDLVSPLAKGGRNRAELFRLRAGLVRGFLIAGEAKAAERAFAKALTANAPDPLLLITPVADLYEHGSGSAEGARRLMAGLDILWRHRDRFAPEVRQKISSYYDGAIGLLQRHGMAVEARGAKERAVALANNRH